MKTHDQLAYEDAFEQRQRSYYIEQSLKNCTEAVNHADNEVAAKILADIGNRARWINRNGDADETLSFVETVCVMMDTMINKYADDQTDLDCEQRLEEGL